MNYVPTSSNCLSFMHMCPSCQMLPCHVILMCSKMYAMPLQTQFMLVDLCLNYACMGMYIAPPWHAVLYGCDAASCCVALGVCCLSAILLQGSWAPLDPCRDHHLALWWKWGFTHPWNLDPLSQSQWRHASKMLVHVQSLLPFQCHATSISIRTLHKHANQKGKKWLVVVAQYLGYHMTSLFVKGKKSKWSVLWHFTLIGCSIYLPLLGCVLINVLHPSTS